MRTVRISDMTLKYARENEEKIRLSFREKIEIAKMLDRLNVDVIEMPAVTDDRTDILLIKSIAMAVKNSAVAVPVGQEKDSAERTWSAVREAKHPRLQVCAPMSTVQMEYFRHKKPEALLKLIGEQVAACRALCDDVEFIAEDASRADAVFVLEAVKTAAAAGAGTVTLCDSAGLMFPNESAAFLSALIAGLTAENSVKIGILCSNTLSMAEACVCAAVSAGVDEVKTIACGGNAPDLNRIGAIFESRSRDLDAAIALRNTEIRRVTGQIASICRGTGYRAEADGAVADEETALNIHDTPENVAKVIADMGYVLSQEDEQKVYEAFTDIASKKDSVSVRELDSIIAAVALQVPPTYQLSNYVISCGNEVSASAHIILKKDDREMEAVSLGDGPIDASFHAVEQIVGKHFELDGFQIKAVTEGREAMGETVVRLLSDGKLYSGRGISTDIVDASVRAYLSAINKVVYEEAEA